MIELKYLLTLVIGILGIGIPVTQEVISGSNLTGITATVVGFVPVILAGVVLFGAMNLW